MIRAVGGLRKTGVNSPLRRIVATALLTLSLVGCAAGASPSVAPATPAPTGAQTATATASLQATPAHSPSAGGTPAAPSLEATANPVTATPDASLAVWRTAQLTDVRTGETFSIESLAGHVVVLEAMAVWCHNCLAQQQAAGDALYQLGDADVVYISLDIDPSENGNDLGLYADQQGFAWHFVVASRELARSLAEEFGDEVLSPPSVPTVTVDPSGAAEIHFGHRNAEDLRADLTARLP